MKKRILPLLSLAVLIFVPSVIAIAHYGDNQSPSSWYIETEGKDKKAKSEIITGPEALKKYAEENGLERVPVRVENILTENATDIK